MYSKGTGVVHLFADVKLVDMYRGGGGGGGCREPKPHFASNCLFSGNHTCYKASLAPGPTPFFRLPFFVCFKPILALEGLDTLSKIMTVPLKIHSWLK